MTEPAQTPTPPVVDPAGHTAQEPAQRGPLHFVWQTVSWILLVAAFGILFAAIVVPKIGGGRPYTILTGSMQPDYPPGTLIVVKPRPTNRIQVGDVITYQLRSGESGVVTHRVVEVTEAEDGAPRFVTKGDANDAVDQPPVRPVQIRGVLWYSIPYLGYVNTWFTGNKRTVTIFVLAGLLFAYAAWQFYQSFREDGRPDPGTGENALPGDSPADTTDAGTGTDSVASAEAATASIATMPSAVQTRPMPVIRDQKEEQS